MYQDSHIHIQDIKADSAIARFLYHAVENNVSCFFGCAITPADWAAVEHLADECPGFIPFFGVHPWFSDMVVDGWEERLKDLLRKYPKACVGETGLDKTRKNIDLKDQSDVFLRHLKIAQEFKRPFALHSVRAWVEALVLIEQNAPGIRFTAHSFNGSMDVLKKVVELNGYFGFSAKQLLNPDDVFKQLVVAAPIDRILIETDFPYQLKWTSPEDYVDALKAAYAAAADIKGIPLEEFITIVRNNGQVCADTSASR